MNATKNMRLHFLNTLNYQVKGLGYININDLLVSTFHVDKNYANMTILSSISGLLAVMLEKYLGLTPVAYIAFLVLILIEFFTGVKASIKAGKKIESRKFGRMIVKIGVYTIMLSIVHILKGAMPNMPVAIYDWIYYLIFNLVVIQLIISVFENLDKLGYTESSQIVKFLKNRISKWFDLENQQTIDNK